VPKLSSAENAGFALLLVGTAAFWQWWRRQPYEENQLKWVFIPLGCIFYLFIPTQTC